MSAQRKLLPLEAHIGEDYAVVMLPGEVTDNASIRIYGEDAPRVTAFIVRACNNHARLIRALDELLEQIDCLNDIEMCRDLPRHEAEACWDGALNAAQDALKLAKEGV